jgi:hypothetical protein
MSKINQLADIILQDRDRSAYKDHLFFVEGLPEPVRLIDMVREILRRLQLTTAPDGSETKVDAGANVTVTGSGTAADPYVISSVGGGGDPVDGSETKVNAGANVTVTGSGTAADPYVISSVGEGGGSFSRDSLAIGSFSAQSDRLGGSPTVLTNPAPGEYTLTVQAGAHIGPTTAFGDNTTLNASQEMLLRVNNVANAQSRRFLVQLYDANNGALVNQQLTGTVHTQSVAGNVTTITIPGLNGFGGTGFFIEIR